MASKKEIALALEIVQAMGTQRKASKVAKVKQPPMKALTGFLREKGYHPVGKPEATTYEKKNGEKIEVQRIKFDNGGSYLVSEHRFWREG